MTNDRNWYPVPRNQPRINEGWDFLAKKYKQLVSQKVFLNVISSVFTTAQVNYVFIRLSLCLVRFGTYLPNFNFKF